MFRMKEMHDSPKIRATKFQAAINFKVFPGLKASILSQFVVRLHEVRM